VACSRLSGHIQPSTAPNVFISHHNGPELS